jgi:hypothetical protein
MMQLVIDRNAQCLKRSRRAVDLSMHLADRPMNQLPQLLRGLNCSAATSQFDNLSGNPAALSLLPVAIKNVGDLLFRTTSFESAS